MRGRNVRNVWIAFHALLARTDALGGAVTARRSHRGAVELHKLRIVNVRAERTFYSF